jgi:hypothetical protein
VTAGTYTLKGTGGKDVGAFTGLMTLGSPLNITGGLPSSVTRSSGIPLSWTGGNSTDLVVIIGSSGTTTGTGANAVTTTTSFICTTTAGNRGFTVPASITQQLPVSTVTSGVPNGFLAVESTTIPASGNGLFNAPLTAGGTVSASFLGLVGTGAAVNYQ